MSRPSTLKLVGTSAIALTLCGAAWTSRDAISRSIVPKPPVEQPETPTSIARKTEQYFAYLDRLRAAETIDDRWREVVHAKLLSELAQAPSGPKGQLIRVDCGRKLCRIDVRHDDESSRGAFVKTVLSRAFTSGAGVETVNVLKSPNALATTAYLGRAGYVVPTAVTRAGD